MAIFLWIAAVCLILLWFVLRPGRFDAAQREAVLGVNHAHRGLHTQDTSVPENSLAAFRAAVQAGYGIELDIQLSKDGRVVVFHDDTLDRVCAVHGRVDEYSFDQLREMRLCGTDETIPLFSQVLEEIDGAVPLIVELKMGPRNNELCQKALAQIRAYHGPLCIESFDPRIVFWFRKNAPDILRGQLTDRPCNFKGQAHPVAAFLLGHLFTNVLARPQFIAHGPGKKTLTARLAESMGALRFCWTVRPGDDIAAKQEENDAVIFEFYQPESRFR